MNSDYETAVERAAAALVRGDDANWELAQLTWERTHGHPQDVLETWAKDVARRSTRQFGVWSAQRYRNLWSWWQKQPGFPDPGKRLSWYEALSKFDPSTGSEARQARAAASSAERYLFGPEAKREDKIEAAKRLLADNDVADAVVADPLPREFVYGAFQRHNRQEHVRHEQKMAADPVSRRFERNEALLRLDTVLAHYVRDIRDLLPQLPPLSPEDPLAHLAFLTQRLADSVQVNEEVARYLATGVTDVESFVRGVLTEGQHGSR